VTIPHVYADLSSATVLVMQRLSGRTVGAANDIIAAMPIEFRAAAGDKLLGAVLRQIMVEGVFHADLHPGNVLVDAGGQLGLLDFGSVGRLDNGSREALAMLLMMAIDRDSSLAATDALLDLLDPPAEGLNERLLERDVGQLMARFRSGGGPASGAFRPALRFGQSAQARSAATGCGCLPHARSLGGHPTTA